MSAAVHGAWCGARTWPTRCPSCAGPVYFFMCNCGSKVFFDELGPPWPMHDCDTSWTRKLRRTTDKSGKITVHFGPGITVSRPPMIFAVDEGIISGLARRKRKRTPDPIIAIEPKRQESRAIVGVLREIARSASPIKAFRFDHNIMGHALLGPIGAQPVGKIAVHAPARTGWSAGELQHLDSDSAVGRRANCQRHHGVT